MNIVIAKRIISQRLNAWIPVILWASLIFYFSSLPESRLPSWWEFPGSDKISHLLEYLILGALLYRALVISRTVISMGRVFWLSCSLTALYALSDEAHQFFVPTRDPSLTDLIADLAGAAVGAIALQHLFKRYAKVRSQKKDRSSAGADQLP